MTKPHRRKCAHCREWFHPSRNNQQVCSITCATAYSKSKLEKEKQKAAAKREKADRAAWREKKALVKPLSHWVQMTQRAVNDWRREMLLAAGHGCISCGTRTAFAWHAGHYRTTAAAPQLRFTPDNIWLQCSACNVHKSGNIEAYRAALVELIGEERVTKLESNNQTHRYSREELERIRAEARANLRAIKQEHAA